MALAAQEMETRPLPKRLRPDSPTQSFADFQRRDGIRKKNARFEIPDNRNLETIERLIAQTTDEEELRQLKQHKRLLRNREAALASRQRKKKHTEDLEVAEKGYKGQIGLLEDEMASMRREHEREKLFLLSQNREAVRLVDKLRWEMEQMAVQHTEVSGCLRKKVQFLSEQLRDAEQVQQQAPPMSVVASSSGCTDFAGEMHALSMAPQHEWENYIWINDFDEQLSLPSGLVPLQAQHNIADYTDCQPPAPPPATITPTIITLTTTTTTPPPTATPTAPNKKPPTTTPPPPSAHHQPITSGLLFMLLICGAFVASRSNEASAPLIPRMPDDVRAASGAVLETIFADGSGVRKEDGGAGKDGAGAWGVGLGESGAVKDRSPASRRQQANRLGKQTSELDRVHDRITLPSRAQQAEQAFAIEPARYASLTSSHVPHSHDIRHNSHPHHHLLHGDHNTDPDQKPKRTLASALAALAPITSASASKRESAADIYTRSLLWDSIPADVVERFRELVWRREGMKVEFGGGKHEGKEEAKEGKKKEKRLQWLGERRTKSHDCDVGIWVYDYDYDYDGGDDDDDDDEDYNDDDDDYGGDDYGDDDYSDDDYGGDDYDGDDYGDDDHDNDG
ncbi:hypothetical protein LTR28_005743 [Elasticomyces elasticus]|nr:hypothetical protein LTR28_005743 [Elasticomyces elasticus]